MSRECVCPWCACIQSDSREMDDGIYDCDTCWNPFELEIEIERIYNVTTVEKNPAHQEHEKTLDNKNNNQW